MGAALVAQRELFAALLQEVVFAPTRSFFKNGLIVSEVG
jgi:hypothetical protein